jgi:hypothetical protein
LQLVSGLRYLCRSCSSQHSICVYAVRQTTLQSLLDGIKAFAHVVSDHDVLGRRQIDSVKKEQKMLRVEMQEVRGCEMTRSLWLG